MGKNISANQLMVLKLFLLKERFHNQTEFISVFFLQLTMKKSRQSDVVERLKLPVPELPKLVSRDLQTKDVLDERGEQGKRRTGKEIRKNVEKEVFIIPARRRKLKSTWTTMKKEF